MTNGSMPASVHDYPNGPIVPTTSSAMGPTTISNNGVTSRIRSTMMSTTPAISLQTSMPPPRRTSSAVSQTTPLSPSSGGGLSATRCMTPGSSSVSPQSPSQDDARRALELVIDYCQNQPSGMLEPQDYVTIGRLMEKLKIHRQGMTGGVGLGLSVSPNSEQLPGGMIEVRKMDGA